METDATKVTDTISEDSYGESGIFAIRSIQYPPEIDPSDSGGHQRHYVRFTINIDESSRVIKRNRVESTTVDNSSQNRLRNGTISQERANNLAAVAAGSVAASSATAGAIISKFSGFPAKLGATGVIAGAGAAAGYIAADSFNVSKKLKKLGATITLYNPGNNTASYNMEYEETNNQIQNILQSERGTELLKDVDNANEQSLWTAAGKFAQIVAIGGSDLLQSLTRSTLNQKSDLLFKKVARRSFQFEYNFMPKNAYEAYDVASIIYMFKYFQHPEMLEGYDQWLYIYPAEFDIEYVYKSNNDEAENIWLNKISSCALESMTVSYGEGGSFQSLVNGEPVKTSLVLRFREFETLHQDRIAKGM